MAVANPLPEKVRLIDAEAVGLPILRELVREIQTRTADQIREKEQYWQDSNWQQWRQHTSHNPW